VADLKVKTVKKIDHGDGSYYIELDVDFKVLKEKKSYLKDRFEHIRITRDLNGSIDIETLPF